MPSLVETVANKHKKHQVVDVKSGDTVRVHQKIREGNKERIQIFEGLVIRTDRKGSLTSTITVRRIASGVGVEKTYLLHSPLVIKVEITKRSKVRRKYLTYMRTRRGKASRLTGTDFDKEAVNAIEADPETQKAEEEMKAKAEAEHAEKAAKEAEEKAKEEAKFEAAVASHDSAESK